MKQSIDWSTARVVGEKLTVRLSAPNALGRDASGRWAGAFLSCLRDAPAGAVQNAFQRTTLLNGAIEVARAGTEESTVLRAYLDDVVSCANAAYEQLTELSAREAERKREEDVAGAARDEALTRQFREGSDSSA